MSRDALVVGINTYNYERLNNLTAPAQDAEAVAQLLEKHGDFKVTRLPAVKDKPNDTIKVGKKTKVTLTQLEEAIVQLFKPEGKAPDTALLYFSGHGLRKNQGIQEGFLATSDVNPDLGNWGVRLKWLRELLQESDVKQQIIILDCCYSGELLNFTEADPGDRGKGRDRCFIAASRPFEVAYVEIDKQHSVFTTALLKGLEPQQNKWVTNYTLVDLLNQEYNSFPQRPIFGNSGEPINLTRRWNEAVVPLAIALDDKAICPYKGLRYFDCTEEDAKYFYGRNALTDELLEKVRLGNFLAVLGASGSGKSSVVRAGLLYQLKLGRRLSGSENWSIKIFKPGENPLQSLALGFLDTELSGIERASQLAQAEELISKGADGLRQLVTSLVTDDIQRLVIVIDQFEEAFALCKNDEERQKFFECILGALQQCGDKLCLVLTMRADFFGKCAEQDYSGLSQQIQQNLVTVTPMTGEELKQAIEKPAEQVELKIEPELVEEMLVDVANAPGSLPLLQDTLTELWKNRSDNCLRLNTYAHLGGVIGTLRQRATNVYDSFDNKEEKAVCKHIFLALTQLGEGTEDTRRRCFKQDLVNKSYSEELVDKVVQRLADEKLIVTSEMVAKGSTSERVAVVDVAHEALIRHWTLLRAWIDENRDKLRQKRKIEAAAEEWRNNDNYKDYLFRGKQLRDAKVFQQEEVENLVLSDLACDFIEESFNNIWGNHLISISYFAFLIYLAICSVAVEIKSIETNENWKLFATEKKYSPIKIQALQNLIRLGANTSDITFSGAKLINTNLSDADLNGANIINANFSGAEIINTNINGANFSDANFIGANFINANFSDAKLINTNLSAADFKYADLSGANLSGANLLSADLRGAKFWDKSKFVNALVEAKNITPEQIKQAKNWEKAIYSPEFRKKLGLPPQN